MLKRLKNTTKKKTTLPIWGPSGRPEELTGAAEVLEFGGNLGNAGRTAGGRGEWHRSARARRVGPAALRAIR